MSLDPNDGSCWEGFTFNVFFHRRKVTGRPTSSLDCAECCVQIESDAQPGGLRRNSSHQSTFGGSQWSPGTPEAVLKFNFEGVLKLYIYPVKWPALDNTQRWSKASYASCTCLSATHLNKSEITKVCPKFESSPCLSSNSFQIWMVFKFE